MGIRNPQSSKNDSKLRRALKRSAEGAGYAPNSKKYNGYVYGTINRIEANKQAKKGGK